MESPRLIKWLLLLGGATVLAPLFVQAYDEKTTHPALTQEIVKFFNQSFPEQKINSADAELIIQGSIDEDHFGRWMRHFYDPIHDKGVDYFGKTWQSSKEWASDTISQATYKIQDLPDRPMYGRLKDLFSGETDYSWERGIYEYAWGDKKRAFEALGHTLHLIEDASVPDHTRNDPHPGFAIKLKEKIPNIGESVLNFLDHHESTSASPYESFAIFNRDIIKISDLGETQPTTLKSITEYFNSIATYSNNKFVSQDTILNKKYEKPRVSSYRKEKLSNGITYTFAYADDGHRLFRVDQELNWKSPDQPAIVYLRDYDNLILNNYWSQLSKQAVLHGAGVMKLFFDEVEKEKKTKELYAKNRSWLGKQIDNFASAAFAFTKLFYGVSVDEKDLSDEETSANVITALPIPAPEPEAEKIAATPAIVPLPPTPSIEPTIPPQTLSSPNPPSSFSPVAAAPFAPGAGASPPPVSSTEETAAQSTSAAADSSATPSDTTAPDISFSVVECAQSLSPTGCLLATTTISLSWSSTADDFDYYVLTGFGIATTTATSTIYAVPNDNTIYTFTAAARDTTGNQSAPQTITVEISTRPLVINEIAWAGTSSSRSADEWIEIYNPTSQTVNLSGMQITSLTDTKPTLNLSGTLASGEYYLIERTDDNTISDITANLTASFGSGIGVGLSNNGEVLAIRYGSTTIDQTPAIGACPTWCGGSSVNFYTMERFDPRAAGTDSTNWGSWAEFLSNGHNADNLAINGTPGRRNGLNYLISPISALASNRTLRQSSSPYVVKTALTINSGATLTIEPGVVVKFYDAGSSITANGAIQAIGTATNKIVFTSFKDDEYGGDLNADATSTSALPGNWRTIVLAGSGSEFNQTIIRYGGKFFSGQTFGWANLKVESTSATIKNSIIEESYVYGLWLQSASGLVEGNTIRGNDNYFLARGIYMEGGSAEIRANTLQGNLVGLRIDPYTNTSNIINNTFTGNTAASIEVVSGCPTFSGNTATGNGLNGISIQGSCGTDYTFTNNLPYILESAFTVSASTTLTINPGAIIKGKTSGTVQAIGRVSASGTASQPIVFTSIHDDSYGGDANNNSTTTAPNAGDWRGVEFSATSASSTLGYVLIRYGGGSGFPSGALRADGASFTLENSTIEHNRTRGIWLSNYATSTFSNVTIQHHWEPTFGESIGLYLENSTPTLTNVTFRDNMFGIQAFGTSAITNGGGIVFEGNDTNTFPSGLIP